jgi:murein DD-endopeptidase MepM/ murein hydrolase activator NlpD
MKYFLLALTIFTPVIIFADDYVKKDIDYNIDLAPPMRIELVLAGNFCEMRSNHFHTGLDIKTKGVEGQRIYSIADGYISRLRVSPWGYGNAIYIEHDNGLTSLYAHCQKFPPYIDSLIYEIQKAYENDVVDKSVIDLKIPVKKGDLLAYSGNSGSSFAPHLHFEIRETLTEHALNPLKFKTYQNLIADHKKPNLRGIKVYAVTNNGYLIPGRSEYFGVSEIKNNLVMNQGKPIDVKNIITENSYLAFGIDAVDKLDVANNICGIYRVELFKDNIKIQEQITEYMNFDHNRFMNSHQDYSAFKYQKKHIHKQFKTVINPLPIYKINNGKIDWPKATGEYTVKLYDAYGNQTNFTFSIGAPDLTKKNSNLYTNSKKYIFPDTVNYIVKNDLQVLFESSTFYEPLEILYKEIENDSNSRYIGNKHHFADELIPLQKQYTIRLRIPESFKGDKNKLCVVYEDSKKRMKFVGGKVIDGWIESKVRAFGDFTLIVDDEAPFINPLDYKNNQTITKFNTLELSITDNIAGIKSYKAYINNKWVLMYYNRKKRKYIIPLNYRSKINLKKGENSVKIVVTDRMNNESEILTTVIY